MARERTVFKKSFPLSYDVEYSLSKLLERELNLARAVEIVVGEIKARYDFNILNLYTAVQGYKNYISPQKYFLSFQNIVEKNIKLLFKYFY